MKLVNGNIKCYLHSGLKIEGKKIKNKQNSICIEETLIVNRSIKTEDHENSLEKIIKKQKTSETTVKLSSNNKILSIIDKGKDKMRNEKEKERKDMPKRKNREKIKTKEREYYLLSGFLSLKVIELVLVS